MVKVFTCIRLVEPVKGVQGRNLVQTLRTVRTALYSVIVAEVVCLVVLNLVLGIVFPIPLFSAYSEIVGIDVLGAVLPLLVSIELWYLWRRQARRRGGVVPFSSRQFWLSILVVLLGALLAFGYVQVSNGGLVLTAWEALYAIMLGGIFGAVYAARRDMEMRVGAVGSEVYAIGAIGLFLSDLVRTFAGWSRVPSGYVLVWGGGGSHDLVLWFGFYMAVSAFAYGKLVSRGLKS